jgi:hypothetical protein
MDWLSESPTSAITFRRVCVFSTNKKAGHQVQETREVTADLANCAFVTRNGQTLVL